MALKYEHLQWNADIVQMSTLHQNIGNKILLFFFFLKLVTAHSVLMAMFVCNKHKNFNIEEKEHTADIKYNRKITGQAKLYQEETHLNKLQYK